MSKRHDTALEERIGERVQRALSLERARVDSELAELRDELVVLGRINEELTKVRELLAPAQSNVYPLVAPETNLRDLESALAAAIERAERAEALVEETIRALSQGWSVKVDG